MRAAPEPAASEPSQASATGQNLGEDNDRPHHPRIIPPGYLLTTRTLKTDYVDDEDGCPEQAHCHQDHTLLWPERSSGEVHVAGQRHTLRLGQGLWLPARVTHSIERRSSAPLSATYIDPSAQHEAIESVEYVVVNPALRELLKHLAMHAMPRDVRLRAQSVAIDLITRESRPTIELPLPTNPRISGIARAIMRDPADNRTIQAWAHTTSQSERTIARGFRTETGLSFTQWRTRARLGLAVQLLGEDMPVGQVSRRVGYATNSAFTAAFQRAMKQPPSDFSPKR